MGMGIETDWHTMETASLQTKGSKAVRLQNVLKNHVETAQNTLPPTSKTFSSAHHRTHIRNIFPRTSSNPHQKHFLGKK